jgi:hypothetical protein
VFLDKEAGFAGVGLPEDAEMPRKAFGQLGGAEVDTDSHSAQY